MSNYQQTTVTGERWLRARKIVIENPLNKQKRIRFVEEKIFNVNGSSLSEGSDILDVIIDSEEDLEKELEIIDPRTGELTGETITYGEVYAILFSAYMHEAIKRDTQPEPEDVDDDPGEEAHEEEETN